MSLDRRQFLRRAALVAGVPLLAPIAASPAAAQALPPLPADHAQGKALAYAADASKVSHPSFKPGSNCANCQFFNAANKGCSLFPGYSVAPNGWCAAWAKKA